MVQYPFCFIYFPALLSNFCVPAKLLQLCPTLDPMDCSPPGSNAHGILQKRILEWFAMPSSRELSQPKDPTQVSCVSRIGRWFFSTSSVQFSSVQLLVVSNSLRPHESQHARPPCPSPTPRVHPNSCPSSR